MLPRLADRAGRRIGPHRLVIRATVVVAGQSEAAGRPKNQQSRRKQNPAGPPKWLRAKPAMRRTAEKLRGIKRRKIRPEIIILSLKRRPRGVQDKGGKAAKNQERLRPPCVCSRRLAEGLSRQRGFCGSHAWKICTKAALIMSCRAVFKLIPNLDCLPRFLLQPRL